MTCTHGGLTGSCTTGSGCSKK